MNTIHKRRLLNVAKACRETKFPKDFTMFCFAHPCGTPACALGNYAARRDLQKLLYLALGGPAYVSDSELAWLTDPQLEEHFGLNEEQMHSLFGPEGCNNAKTPLQAARYIERFVARRP